METAKLDNPTTGCNCFTTEVAKWYVNIKSERKRWVSQAKSKYISTKMLANSIEGFLKNGIEEGIVNTPNNDIYKHIIERALSKVDYMELAQQIEEAVKRFND